jgi:hypothetical protein
VSTNELAPATNRHSECCLSGKVHEGTPTGKIETIDNLPTYVAAPNDGSKAKSVVFLVDSMALSQNVKS